MNNPLYIFRLIQFTDQNILTIEHEQFFIQFVNELSSDKLSISERSKKRLQTSLHDLIFVLRAKRKPEFETLLKKLPEKVQNIFTMIDMIDITLNGNKPSVLPTAILEYAKQFDSGETFLTNEQFEKSNEVFNRAADIELIHFLDEKNPTLIGSETNISNFFAEFPKESEVNETFYKNYPILCTLPADCICFRARYLYVFNSLVGQTLWGIDLSLPSEQSILTNYLRKVKVYLLQSTKWCVFQESLEATGKDDNSNWTPVHFDTVKASINDKSEDTMFYQAYQQLYGKAHNIFRQNIDQLWRAQYLEMHSTDQGGPYRDSITRIVADICSTRLPLFILCPNGRTNTGTNRDCWIPNVFPSDKAIAKKFKKQYRFVGQLMGMAIRKKHYFDLKFAPLVWKSLLQEDITVQDIEAIDQQSFTMIYDLEKNVEQIQSIGGNNDLDYLFSSILDELRFDVVSSGGQTYELIPGGSDIPITMANFKQYCSSYRQYRLEEFHRQIKYIRQGVYSIIPSYYLSLFTSKELEEAVCGKGQIDVDLLKRNTYYGGDFSENTPHIQRFWNVFRDVFTDEQRKLFLIFVWGRSTLPTQDADFQSKFVIARYDIYDDTTNVDQVLPRMLFFLAVVSCCIYHYLPILGSHTCFFTLDLPEYSTEEIMSERLNYAFTCCSSIDGDGMMNEAPGGGGGNELDSDSDDSDDDE